MSLFQQYQAEFTAHIRDPRAVARPKGVPARRMKVYTEIVFNNMEATLSACFPVVRKVLGVRRWTRLVRAFFAQHRCATPWFRQIPEEFLRWLEATQPQGLPPFLPQLAHYEWVELALAVADAPVPPHDADGDLLAGVPVLAPALMLLRYDWPVQRISPRHKPATPLENPVHLLVFRDAQDEVRFIEINPLSARLLGLLQAGGISGSAALQVVAEELQHPAPAAILQHGAALLADLHRQGAVIGTRRA
jgi:uncharacterized protein